ncbi:NADPH-dependent oxidoreductase [Burkholderia sp. Bp9140]|nr:NADPH-dependent oxidoreductase [Burkholderia sp. Bp9140]
MAPAVRSEQVTQGEGRADAVARPLIVGLGGTTTTGSSTERAVKIALSAAEHRGARTQLFDGAMLSQLSHYSGDAEWQPMAKALVAAVRQADGLILGSPGYHGSISGLIKNALDHLEATARDARPYLDGLPVGLVATAYGWQATGGTLAALRSIVHALRGWPTPFGAAINTSTGMFRGETCTDETVVRQLEMVGYQVVEFAEKFGRPIKKGG